MKLKKLLSKRNIFNISIFALIGILFFILIYFLFPIQIINIDPNQEVVIKYADNISPAHQKVIDNFNQAYKGRIRVEAINLPFSKFSTNERKELLTRSLRSKSDKLDIFSIDLIWSARFAKWAEPLDDYITVDEIFKLLPQALESCVVDNKIIALPIYLDIGVLYYRRDFIQALPNSKEIEEKLKNSITWDEFFKLSQYFNNEVNPFYIFPADNYEGLVCSFFEILVNQKENFFQQAPFDWNTQEVRNTFQHLSDIINKHKITPRIVTDYRENSCYDYFIYNHGVFLRGWASFPKESQALLESIQKAKLIEQVALPHLKGSQPASTIGGWNMMISKYSENKEAAVEFVKFIIEEESQKIFYENGALLPVISSIYEDDDFISSHPSLMKNKKLLDSGVHRPVLDNYTKISDVISFYANKVMKNQISVDSAVANANNALISGELILR